MDLGQPSVQPSSVVFPQPLPETEKPQTPKPGAKGPANPLREIQNPRCNSWSSVSGCVVPGRVAKLWPHLFW